MSNISKKFVTLGLRRERNLSDTEVPETALNSLLDNLVDEPNKSFLSEDLNAIRGIQNTNITPNKLSELAGITVNTSISELFEGNPVIVERPITPLITLNDRIENAKIVTGEIPAIQGGNGLLARFVPSSNISTGTKLSTGDDIFITSSEQTVEIFWDNGFFNFPSALDTSFVDQYGGIQWTGFFAPALRDPNINIVIFTTGLFIFEIDPNETNSWITASSLFSDVRTLSTISANGTVSQVTLDTGEIRFVGVNDLVNGTEDVAVTDVNLSTSVVTFSKQTPITSNQVTFRKILGQTITRSTVNLPAIEVGKQIKIRFSFWFPDNSELLLEKYLEFNYISSQLRYTNLYSSKPSDTPDPFEIRSFLSDAVSPYQTNVGGSLDNKNVYFNNSINLSYNPNKTSLASIRTQGPVSVTFSNFDNIIRGTMPNAQIGNIIVPASSESSINSIVRIKDTISANVRVIDNSIGVSETISVNIADHRGFINWYRATSLGSVVTLTAGDAKDLTVGMLIVTSTSNSYIRVTEINSSTTFTTSTELNLSGTQIIYAYGDRSLIDRSKDIFCDGVFGRTVTTNALQGATQLTLDSVTNVADGQYIQFDGVIPINTQVVGAAAGNVVTISNPLTAPLSSSNTVVFVPQTLGGVINREGCVVPLDTSPPFSGTERGLATSNKGIKTDSGIATLAVTVNSVSTSNTFDSANITTISYNPSATTFDRKFSIKSKIGNTIRSFSVLSNSS